jgi:hypothetical protein
MEIRPILSHVIHSLAQAGVQLTHLVHDVDVRSSVQQQSHNFKMSVASSPMKGWPAALEEQKTPSYLGKHRQGILLCDSELRRDDRREH